MSFEVSALAILAAVYLLYKIANATDTPRIKNLPEIPGLPIFGSLITLGDRHSTVLGRLAKKYGAPVFQIRMGNRRIVVANTYETVKELWVKNQAALISRPMFHTFHSVVSSSQGFTIGTSPWDDSCKNRRKAAATALNRPAVSSYIPLIEEESTIAIRDIYRDSKRGTVDVDIKDAVGRFALSISLTLNYGISLDPNNVADNKLFHEVVAVEAAISRFRSTSNNWQDYVPLLRYISPAKTDEAKEFKDRRDKYMDYLLNRLKQNIANGTDRPCITGNILKDPDAKFNEAEIKSLCLTMVSAGLDTVPANFIQGIGYLSTPHGQSIQETAYNEIMSVYPNGDAWERCLHEEKLSYITALVKETLRYFTVIPICLPRTSIRDIQFRGATIPAGTLFYMNAYAADHDSSFFQSPEIFNPSRFLKDSSDSITGTPHYAYGAGSRMCAGSHLANRELYTMFARCISEFKILPPEDKSGLMEVDPMENNACLTALVAEPKRFKCRFEPRDRARLEGERLADIGGFYEGEELVGGNVPDTTR